MRFDPVGPVTTRSPSAAKKGLESFSARARASVEPLGARPRERRRVHDGAGRVGRPVAPVRPGRQDDDVPHRRQLRDERQRELLAPPPVPRPRTVTVVSPPAIRHAGRADGRAGAGDLVEDGRELAGHLARLALEAPRQEAGREPEPARLRHRRVHDEPVVADDHVRDPGQRRVARLRRVRHLAPRPGLEMRPHRRPAPGRGARSGPAPPARRRRWWDRARSAPRRSRPADRRSRRRAGGRRPGAGCAARASWPPFSRERCFRTAFSSLIVAPDSRRRRVTACFSARLTPGPAPA